MKQMIIFALALTLVVAKASTVHAGSRVDLTPSLAYFNPTGNVVEQDGLTAKFAGGLGFGGRVSIWLNENVVLEGSGHYGRTTLDGQLFGDAAGSLDLALFYGSVQLSLALGAEKRFLLHGGLGLQGTNYDELITGGNIMTGVFGISGWAPLSETASLRADLDVHVHTMYFEVDGLQTDELTQYDIVATVGIQFSTGGD